MEYKNLYAGIDLVYYGNQGQLEYDLVVAPGADASQIMLAFDGVERLLVDEQGDLVLTLPHSSTEPTSEALPTLRLQKPVVYQRDDQGEKHLLAGTYVLKAASDQKAVPLHYSRETHHIAFQIASYDESKPLIIDPVLSWATYLGGSGFDGASGIAIDQAGNVYVTGGTWSSNFPGTAGSLIQSTSGGDDDAFVTKLNAAGTAILYATYLGGSRSDGASGIAVDIDGNVYVTGRTGSSGFPGTSGSPIQSTMGSRADAFVTKLNETGTAIVYSTYLGGSGIDLGEGIAVDGAGNAYVTGETTTLGSGFPDTAKSPIQPSSGDGDAFVTKLNAPGTAILYSTYLGGNGYDFGQGIAVDAAGNAYVTGITGSADFPGTAGSPIQRTHGGASDAFITKLNAAGTAILYSTYLGGSDFDYGIGIVVDAAGNAYVAGATGGGIPGTASSLIQSTLGGAQDAFVAKITSANIVNDLVTFVPDPSTYRTTTDPTGCPSGFVGKFWFDAQLTNKNGSPPLSELALKVTDLTNGNLLQNADGGNGGIGSMLTVPKTNGYADGTLSPGESVGVNFSLCLKARTPFSFFVDVLGVQ